VKKQKITWIASDPYGWDVQPRPVPATQYIPDWWRDMTPYVKTPDNPYGNKLIIRNRDTNAGPKKCVPMLDAMNIGYIIPLWSDIQVGQVNGNATFSWRLREGDVLSLQGPGGLDIEQPPGYTRNVVKYINTWIPTTPPGYSVLITAPIGYRNLPFHAIPAVIDSDKSQFELTAPMWVREDLEGIVEKGTPMLQIIPFKRDNWESEFKMHKEGVYNRIYDKTLGSTLIGHYLKNNWSKKEFK
jgi:hypothetical protein